MQNEGETYFHTWPHRGFSYKLNVNVQFVGRGSITLKIWGTEVKITWSKFSYLEQQLSFIPLQNISKPKGYMEWGFNASERVKKALWLKHYQQLHMVDETNVLGIKVFYHTFCFYLVRHWTSYMKSTETLKLPKNNK